MAHILVIDDNEAVLTTMGLFFERLGHIVSLAANGREGLRMLQQERADVVVTDILMPEADGLEVILEIKKRYNKESGEIPIIAMSGGSHTRDEHPICFLQQAKLFGAARTFTKPIDFHGMHNAILELLAAPAV